MTVWRGVGPEVREIYAFRIDLVAIAAVVAKFLATMPTGLNRYMNLVEHSRNTACIVKKCVMCGIEFFPPRISSLHGERDPVSKIKVFFQRGGVLERELRRGVQKKGATGLQHTAALENPRTTPLQIVGLRSFVVVAVPVVLSEVEWGVGKNGVDDAGPHAAEKLETIDIVEDAVGGREEGGHVSIGHLGVDVGRTRG